MKNNHKLFTIIVSLFMIACTKETNDINSNSDCKLSSITYDADPYLKFDITYSGNKIVSMIQSIDNPDYKMTFYYNNDNLLSHKYLIDIPTNRIVDVDSFIYNSNKQVSIFNWYSVDEDGKRDLEYQSRRTYNEMNQLISYRDSTLAEFDYRIYVGSIEYSNNRKQKETKSIYDKNNNFKGKEIYEYIYSNTPNNIFNIIDQSTDILYFTPTSFEDFKNTDLLVSRVIYKEYDNENTLVDTYTIEYTYTTENGKLVSVSNDNIGPFLKFGYNCE
ncbi:MAG: hypothetical protein RIS29_711 [Bacteroidota bacterium]